MIADDKYEGMPKDMCDALSNMSDEAAELAIEWLDESLNQAHVMIALLADTHPNVSAKIFAPIDEVDRVEMEYDYDMDKHTLLAIREHNTDIKIREKGLTDHEVTIDALRHIGYKTIDD